MTPDSNIWQSATVAITGMNNRPDNPGPGYGVARCLREMPGFNGRIIGLGYDALDGGLYHRGICDAGCLLPYPSNSEAALLERLQYLHELDPIDVLIPTLDAELPALIRLRPHLEQLGIEIMIPTQDQLRQSNKERLPDLCQRAGVRTPRTQAIANPGFFDCCNQEGWQFPLLVKGRFYDAQVVYSPEEARAAFYRIAQNWGLPLIVQAQVTGEEYNLAGLGDGRGQLTGAVMMRKQALTEKGKGWAGTSIHHPELLDVAQRLVATLQWQGPLEIEMLRDNQGQFHLLEINPRFPAWIYLSHGAGCNLPALLLQSVTGACPPPPPAKPGVMFIRYAEELLVSLEQFAQMTSAGSDGLARSNPESLRVAR